MRRGGEWEAYREHRSLLRRSVDREAAGQGIRVVNGQLTVGSGACGAALVVEHGLGRAYTSECEAFGSPRLFGGREYARFNEAEVADFEVVRFVLGEGASAKLDSV